MSSQPIRDSELKEEVKSYFEGVPRDGLQIKAEDDTIIMRSNEPVVGIEGFQGKLVIDAPKRVHLAYLHGGSDLKILANEDIVAMYIGNSPHNPAEQSEERVSIKAETMGNLEVYSVGNNVDMEVLVGRNAKIEHVPAGANITIRSMGGEVSIGHVEEGANVTIVNAGQVNDLGEVHPKALTVSSEKPIYGRYTQEAQEQGSDQGQEPSR